jgi:hypothetical protein
MLIAVMPPETDISNVLGEIVHQIANLSSVALYFAPLKRTCHFKCELSLLLGDSPASNSLIGKSLLAYKHLIINYLGLRAPTCNQPCRFCHVDAIDLGTIPVFNLDDGDDLTPDNCWTLRHYEETLDLVAAAHNFDDNWEDNLKENGVTYYLVSTQYCQLSKRPNFVKSPLWQVCNNLFVQSPYCLLHNEFLGLIPIHLDFTVASLKAKNEQDVRRVAERVAAFPAFAPLPKLNADIEERRGWDGKSYTSFYKMAVIIFRGILAGEEMQCWYGPLFTQKFC